MRDDALKHNEPLFTAYLLKEALGLLWEQPSYNHMRSFLYEWCAWADQPARRFKTDCAVRCNRWRKPNHSRRSELPSFGSWKNGGRRRKDAENELNQKKANLKPLPCLQLKPRLARHNQITISKIANRIPNSSPLHSPPAQPTPRPVSFATTP
ncbi:MAG: transposase [Verrucomicrobia bacterium]|nr:transposase [Verrucomicrobiota bacterium]